jgi:hypothetical protein
MNKIEIQSNATLLQARIAYTQGVTDTLEELREVYGAGIELTDIWAEYMTKEAN